MVSRRLCGKLFTSTVTEEKLKGFDVTTIADLRRLDLSVLELASDATAAPFMQDLIVFGLHTGLRLER